MTTKRSRKATETAIVEAVEDEVQSTELLEAGAVEEVRETDQVEAPQPKALPAERRCPSHAALFPEESEVRPINEFSIRDGRVQPTYCKKCNSKKHNEYAKRRRQEAAQSVERLQAIVDQKRAELAAAEEQLQYIMDLEHEAVEREAEA